MSSRWQIQSLEAERTVAGGVLVHPKALDDCLGVVEAEHFSDLAIRVTWEAIVALDKANLPIDAVTVWQHLQTLGTASRLRQLGGIEFLTTLMAEVVTIENIAHHAGVVAKLAERRTWAAELRELTTRAGDESTDSATFFSEVEGRLLQLMMQRKSTTTMLDARQGMRALVNEIEKRFDEKDKPEVRGVPTGFYSFDHATGGFKPGQLIVLAARPRVGKSAWTCNAIEYAARRKIPCLLFSLEMEALEHYERMVAANGVKADALRTGNLNQTDFQTLTKTASELGDQPRIWIDDQPELTITELRSRARRWRSRAGAGDLALVAVDYLQLVRSGRKSEISRQDEVAEVSRGLKALAKELRCPVLALAQINREADKRSDQRPKLSDLRESGQIEADADIVLFLYREEIADRECSEELKGTAELIIGKGRGLPEWPYKLRYDGTHTKFSNPR